VTTATVKYVTRSWNCTQSVAARLNSFHGSRSP